MKEDIERRDNSGKKQVVITVGDFEGTASCPVGLECSGRKGL